MSTSETQDDERIESESTNPEDPAAQLRRDSAGTSGIGNAAGPSTDEPRRQPPRRRFRLAAPRPRAGRAGLLRRRPRRVFPCRRRRCRASPRYARLDVEIRLDPSHARPLSPPAGEIGGTRHDRHGACRRVVSGKHLDRLARPVGDPRRSGAPSTAEQRIEGGGVDRWIERRERRSRGLFSSPRARTDSDPDHRVHR